MVDLLTPQDKLREFTKSDIKFTISILCVLASEFFHLNPKRRTETN